MLEVLWFFVWAFWLVVSGVVLVVYLDAYERKLGIRGRLLGDMPLKKSACWFGACLLGFCVVLSVAFSPWVVELPKDFSGKSVATVEEGGRFVYHPYGILTPPWKWDEQTVVTVREINLNIAPIAQAVVNKRVMVGVVRVGAHVVTTNAETYALACATELTKKYDIVWKAKREIVTALVQVTNLDLGEKPEDPGNVELCEKIIAKANLPLAIYGVKLRGCRAVFSSDPVM
jgi:hypothetical protein